MKKIGLIGHNGMCGKELLKLLPNDTKIFSRNDSLVFSDLDVLFMAISSEDTLEIAQQALEQNVRVIDLSSAFRTNSLFPLILPKVNSHLINNSLKLVSLPNCIVSILLTVLNPLHKIAPIKKIILSTYQAASGAGNVGLEAMNSYETIAPFPHPLRDNLFLHESKKNLNELCGEEEKIVFEIKKILNTPDIPISVRCVRLPIKRAHSIHAIVTFEQNIHNINELLINEPGILMHPSPTPKMAEEKDDVFVAPVRKDPSDENTYDFWIVGDQILRGSVLNAYEAFMEIEKAHH
jgi:aspartate-semialdehyde dehydrogenase